MSDRPRTVSRAIRIGSLICSTLIGLALLEAGFRIFIYRRLTIDSGIEDPHYHHRLKPNTTYHFYSKEFDVQIRTNRFGLRGPDPVLPKSPGRFRMLMLGDSFTFGFPVRDEETFCRLIERGLNERGYPVDVINGGVSGYSPTLEYISLRDQFLSFEPDLVILWYDRGDLQDDAQFRKNLLYDARGHIVRCDPRYINGRFDWWEWGQNRSAILRYVQNKLVRTIEKARVLGLGGYLKVILRGERAKAAIAKLKGQQQAGDLALYDRFLMIRETTTPELLSRYWPISARYLRMIRDLLAEHGIPFVLGTYPYGVTVGPNQWDEGRVYWGFERGRLYHSPAARATFQQFAQEEGIPLIRTKSSFRKAAPTAKLYYDWDGHMTPAGHQVFAAHVLRDEAFLAFLRQQIVRRLGQDALRAVRDDLLTPHPAGLSVTGSTPLIPSSASQGRLTPKR